MEPVIVLVNTRVLKSKVEYLDEKFVGQPVDGLEIVDEPSAFGEVVTDSLFGRLE